MSNVPRTFATMNFTLELVEERIKPHQVTALHLIAALTLTGAGGLCFLIRSYAPSLPVSGAAVLIAGASCILAGLALLGIVIFRNRWLLNPHINHIFRIAELIMLSGTAAFFTMFQWWIPAAMSGIVSVTLAFSLFWERGKNRRQYIAFSEDVIRLPVTSRRKQLSWPEVERVIFRFGVLTIDCHDNHLMQWNVQPPAFDPGTLEAWCITQIEAGKANRIKSNW